MKLAISNIGWTNEEELDVAKLLQSLSVKYVEIAPTKKWPEPLDATDEQIESYRSWWAGFGIEIVAFQSMLFSHADYKLFENDENRLVTQKYLQDFSELAGKMGAKRLVFGSPRNRQKGSLSTQAANEIAVDFFGNIGTVANTNAVIFCIEPNAQQYNCDFVRTANEGIEIVRTVNNSGFGLHLDIACMVLAGDDITASISGSRDILEHFHISSPMLELVEDRSDVGHREAASALRDIGYRGYVSIEMRPGDTGTNVDRVKSAVLFAQQVYS
jgi:D-psicose/D-tagatose/L-ribulose 3-epimerase